MSSEIVISAKDLGKVYQIYKQPSDRLKQMLWRGRRRFYEEYWALRELSLSVKKGETIGIIGRNGSGKSTLLQMLCGTLSPSTGSLEVQGRIAALLELGAGFNPEFSGRENVFLAASVLGLTEEKIKERFAAIEEFAGIGDFIDQAVKIYSSGMYARLAFAVAAHVDADILIIDEILSVGDAAFTQKCMRFIHEFKKNGTIFFVSHDSGAVVSLCDRVIWLDNGRLREEGEAKEVCHHYLAALEAEKDVGSDFKIGGERKKAPPVATVVNDPRLEVLRESQVKNTLQLFEFDPQAPWFGRRGISITSVSMLEDGQRLSSVMGGETVTLQICCRAESEIRGPIVGFFIKDRLGQALFGDNSYLSYQGQPKVLAPAEVLTAEFTFQMPFLPKGDFSVTVAVAEGTQDSAIQHHWIEDALFFQVLSSHVSRGLIGVPMLEIVLR